RCSPSASPPVATRKALRPKARPPARRRRRPPLRALRRATLREPSPRTARRFRPAAHRRRRARGSISISRRSSVSPFGRHLSAGREAVDAPAVYRNGHGKPRKLAMMGGTIEVRRPRMRDLEEAAHRAGGRTAAPAVPARPGPGRLRAGAAGLLGVLGGPVGGPREDA